LLKKKKEKNKSLKSELSKIKSFVEDCKKEVRWNQNSLSQKENDIKIYLEKIKKLSDENCNLGKKLNKKSNANKLETNEEVVMTKPFLFGPEEPEK